MKDNPIHERINEIIHMAQALGWLYPTKNAPQLKASYPLMQLSEVEKCMIAMVDEKQLDRMKAWYVETLDK